jgi:hypothetical protein
MTSDSRFREYTPDNTRQIISDGAKNMTGKNLTETSDSLFYWRVVGVLDKIGDERTACQRDVASIL